MAYRRKPYCCVEEKEGRHYERIDKKIDKRDKIIRGRASLFNRRTDEQGIANYHRTDLRLKKENDASDGS